MKELVPEGGRNKTAPNRFRPDEKNKPNHRRDQPEKLILPSVIAKPVNIKRLNQAMTKSQQALKTPRVSGEVSLATKAGLAQIEGSAALNSDIQELVKLSLTVIRVNGSWKNISFESFCLYQFLRKIPVAISYNSHLQFAIMMIEALTEH